MTATPREMAYLISPQARPQRRAQANDAARRKGDDNDQHRAIDRKIYTWRVARDNLGRLAERSHRERAGECAKHGTAAAHDRGEQSLDRHARSERDRGIDEQKILRIEAAGGR